MDGDGLGDAKEVNLYGTDPLDPDSDGLTNLEEFQNGTLLSVADTDGDGLNDGDEIAEGLNPLDPDDCPVRLCPLPSSVLKLILLFNR